MPKYIPPLMAFALFGLATSALCAPAIDRSQHPFMVYKTSSCQCCNKWIHYLEQNGFQVQFQNLKNLVEIKSKYHIVQPYASCHTAVVNGYVVEGHVPIVAIEKILLEKPDIYGITVPGMPPGSPGMESLTPVAYSVYSVEKNGEYKFYMRIPK